MSSGHGLETVPGCEGVVFGPGRGDGLPLYITWGGRRFDTPEFEMLEAWTIDSLCEDLAGAEVEHDCEVSGEHGMPSWLLALGLV